MRKNGIERRVGGRVSINLEILEKFRKGFRKGKPKARILARKWEGSL